MRYGREGKDYFWIQDLQPKIVMHPYRKDLDGQDVSDFRDARGVRIFVEFADLVRRQQEGYIEYVWQWKDDPRRLAPKESYIRGFPRWQWVIGTGIYLDDVRQEITRLERNLVSAAGAIVVLVTALLLYVVREGLGLEQERSRAEAALSESTQRYRSLVESARDGTLLVLNGRLRYANPVLLERLGYSAEELELRDLDDLVPRDEGNHDVWSAIDRAEAGQDLPASVTGALRHRDGRLLEAVLTFSPIIFAGERGFILHERDLAAATGGLGPAASEALARAAGSVRSGLFRALAARRGTVVAANPAAARLLASLRPTGRDEEPALADLFADPDEWQEARRELIARGEVERRLAVAGDDATTRILALAAVAVADDTGQIGFIDGVVEDVTAAARGEAERRLLLERLQASLLFLYEPVRTAARTALSCATDTSLSAAATLMTRQEEGAVLVQGPNGEPLGLLSDHALRRHIGLGGRDLLAPAFKAMTAPLVTVSENAPVYEALLRLEESGATHVVVEDDGGQAVGIVDAGALLQFQSYGSFVLTREIARATNVDEVVRCCRRLPAIATSLLDSGAQTRHITRMVASVADAATERFLALAAAELGPPPAEHVWVALGSQGRHEQTLFTDQDNAIIYTPAAGAEEATHAYFVATAGRVTAWLDRAGYRLCPGEVMASNPVWCQPLDVWKRYFRDWIREAQPKQLIEMSILFDMRAVCGTAALVRDLRREVHACLRSAPDFYPLFARNAVEFRPPPRFFGKILPSGTGGDSLRQLDLKDAMHPIVAFSRLYALRHELEETHTVERLRALAERDLILTTTRDDVTAAYDFLMRLRLQHQASRIRIGATVDNVIPIKALSHADLTLLKHAFAEIDAVQRKVSFEFLGGM